MEDCGSCECEIQRRSVENLNVTNCHWCKSNRPTFLYRNRNGICWQCLELTWTRKIKSDILKCRENKMDEFRAVFAFNGNIQSTVLLSQLGHVMDKNRSFIMVCYIDIQCVFNESNANTQFFYNRREHLISLIECVDQIVGHRGWHLRIYKLENLLKIKSEELCSIFSSLKQDATSQMQLLDALIRNALIILAHESGFDKIILAQTGSTLSSQVILNCTLGRGLQIAELSSLITSSFPYNVKFIKPLRNNIIDREVAYYYHKKRLNCVIDTRLDFGKKSSLQSISKLFISNLQRDYDHTVHTVLRSVDRLQICQQPDLYCSLCMYKISQKDFNDDTLRLCYSCKNLVQKFDSLPFYKKLLHI